ncbi:hypothetical protein HK44_008585 [Pseudomonas fluorescens HK44]|uniref:Uncharacterized protein n=1 Tax=Pseudomonas fluorescens HK44 TaxID=1042209 RepID=A0A010ST50_PSEFL|nr:hypothetical protein HK44_008585 [Pseudomonas fluorescens HK44]
MDELALFKGHRYASVELDADTRGGVVIGEGRSAARKCFHTFKPSRPNVHRMVKYLSGTATL